MLSLIQSCFTEIWYWVARILYYLRPSNTSSYLRFLTPFLFIGLAFFLIFLVIRIGKSLWGR